MAAARRNFSSNSQGHARQLQEAEETVPNRVRVSGSAPRCLPPIYHMTLVSRALVFSKAKWGCQNVRTSQVGLCGALGTLCWDYSNPDTVLFQMFEVGGWGAPGLGV
jgi:hypothetical protein